MRILFVHEVNYLTKPIYEMHEFPEHLAARGHDVAFWHFPEGFSNSVVRNLGFKSVIKGRVVDGASITLYTPQSLAGNLRGRLRTALSARRIAKKVLRDFRPNLIVSYSVPTQGWQLLSVAKRFGIPVLFRALDVSHKIRSGPFAWLIKCAERFVYRGSDFVSANNASMLRYCSSISGEALVRASVHFPPLDLGAFSGGSRANGRELLGLSGSDQVVLYMGSFFYFSGLPDAVRRFAQLDTPAKLVLVGGGEQGAELKSLVESLGVKDRVLFPGFVSFASLPDVLAAADVAINPMDKTLVSDAALPNKVLQYLASGVRTVTTPLEGLVATFGSMPGLYYASGGAAQVIDLATNLASSGNDDDFGPVTGFLEQIKNNAVGSFEATLIALADNK